MADIEWYKNLAEAEYVNGKWKFEDPERVEQILSFKVKTVINNLFDDVGDAIEIYNQHARTRSQINCLPISDTYSNALAGFVLLLETSQIKLLRKNQHLEVYSINISGHTTQTKLIHKLSPCYDALGSLMWSTGDKNLINEDLIVKLVMEEIVKDVADNR